MPRQLRNMELMLKVAERAAVMALHEAPSAGGRSRDGPDHKCESKIMNALHFGVKSTTVSAAFPICV